MPRLTHVSGAIWAEAVSGMTGTGTIGKLLADDIDAKVTSRMKGIGGTAVNLGLSDLKVESDSLDVEVGSTDAYVLYKTITLTPTASQVSYGKRATLVVEFQATKEGGGTGHVKTQVDDADDVITAVTTSPYSDYRQIHADITSFAANKVVKVWLNCDGNTGTIAIQNVKCYLQIGTKSTSIIEVLRFNYPNGALITLHGGYYQVWTALTDTASIYIGPDASPDSFYRSSTEEAWSQRTLTGSVVFIAGSWMLVEMLTSAETNPAILKQLRFGVLTGITGA